MEPSKEPVSVRIARLNNLFLGRAGSSSNTVVNKQFLGREGLLDALLVLYDECNNDTLKKEKNIAGFVEKFRGIVSELRRLRVNVSDFEVKKVIGRGHFGEVQVVREKQTGDVYAMKTLRKSDTLNQQGAAFYQEERDIMAQTNSPWLTLLQYAFQDMNNLYLVMEFHPGGDLLSLLDRFDGTLSEDMARFYLAELAMAVHSLHNMGYVHRDIKPDNVLIDRCGHLKLADFGSAARLTAAGVVTSQLPVGTPEYIAPEVLQALDQATNGVPGKQGNYGMECDYWSLGVVAYEMIMGRTPFSGEQLSATYNNIMRHENTLQFPSDINTSTSFQDLIMGLLQDAVNRLNHEKLLKHEFFSAVDWANLRDAVPPFVPVVNSEDDTSNFVEFEYEPPMPSIENFKIRKEFSGKDLSFIGFTYTHDIAVPSSSAEGTSFIEKDKNPCNSAVEAVLAARKKEVEDLHRKLQEIQQPEKWRDISALERKVEEYTRRLEVVESDRNQLELCLEKSKHEAQALKRTLDLEREDRKSLETNAISMIRESKSRWEKCHRHKLQDLQKYIESKDKETIELSCEKERLLTKVQRLEEELKTTRQEIEHLQELVGQNKDKMAKVREKTRMSIAGVETRLDQIAADKQQQVINLKEALEKQIQYAKELEGRLGEAEATLLEKTAELSVKCDKLHSEKMALYTELELSVEKYLELESKTEEEMQKRSAAEKSRILDLEDQLYEEKKRNSKLQEQVMRMEKEKRELRELQEKNTSIQIEWREEHQSQLITLEAELKEAIKKQTELQCNLQEATEEKLKLVSEKVNIEGKLQEVEGITSRLESENMKLKEQLSTLRESNQTSVCNNHADTISELAQQKGFLEIQLEKLEDQLEKTKETLVLERDAAKSTQSQLWKKEKDLSDAKIDLRIAQREARTAEQELKVLQEEKSEWMAKVHEDKNSHARELSSSWAKIEELREEQKGLRRELEKHQQQAAELSHKLELEKNVQVECKQNLEATRLQLKAAKEESTNWKRQVDFSEKQTTSLQAEIDGLRKQNTGLQEERASLIKKLGKVDNQRETLDMNIKVLKETCTMLEEQLEDYDKLFSARDEKDKIRESEIAKLQIDIEKLQSDVRGARQATNEEKTFRIIAETKLQQLEADISSQTECVSTLQAQLQDYRSLAESLTQQITSLENSAGENELVLRTTRRQLEALQEENTGLKEEISRHLTTTHNLRESGFKLSRDLEEALDRGREIEARLAQLEAEMEEQQVFHQHREIKADATLKQQTKLIDFLQRSLLEHSKKKKTLTDKLFGRQKENVAPALPTGIGSHVNSDLKVQLVREQNKVKFLMEQLENAKLQLQQTGKRTCMPEVDSHHIAAPRTPNTQRVLSHIVQSPASQQRSNFERQPSLQRMHHNIPHRFEPKLSMRVTKCAVCLDSIHFGRHAVVCQECNVTAHPKCSQAMPTTCGLPSGFVHHFSKTWNNNGSTSKGDTSVVPASVEGYVKLPNHGHSGWQSHYLRLRGTALEIFANKPATSNEVPVSTFEMCSSAGIPRVLSAVPCSDVVGTASSDIPFILKVEVVPRTTCWPSATSLFIMALSFPDKQKWVQALEAVVQQGSGHSSADNDRYTGQCIMKLGRSSGQAALDLNCCIQITDQLLLLGAEEGLYSVRLQEKTDSIVPVHIQGPTHVHQIALVPALNFAIMIAGERRVLVQCDLRHLKTAAVAAECSNPSVDTKPVMPATNSATCCHLFAISPVCGSGHNATVTLCVATSDKFIVLMWNIKQESFVPVKMLDTSDPCSCIHFTSHSVIVGSNKFFELDLKNFIVEEFMDSSDITLAHAVVGTRQLNSFPLAVLDVSALGSDGKSLETEYLLCFNELGVFVDQYGRRAREDDIKWSHLPLAFVYRRPYLIIVHFTSVEVMRLTSSSFTRGKDDDTSSTVNYPDQTFIELNNPRYLGTASKSTAVYISTNPLGSIDVLFLDAAMACRDDVTLSLTDIGSDGADLNDCGSVEFSFTSSLVQSLDGELDSESLPSEERDQTSAQLPPRTAARRVQFENATPHTAL